METTAKNVFYPIRERRTMRWRFTILYCTSLMIRCVFKIREIVCAYTRETVKEKRQKKGEWGNEGENDGGVKQSETKNEKREGDGGQWRRREDRQTRWYHYKRADNRISTQFVWDPYHVGWGTSPKSLVPLPPFFDPAHFVILTRSLIESFRSFLTRQII